MSTIFDVRRWATQAGIQTTGGFAVIAECVTMDELQRFAEIAIEATLATTPAQPEAEPAKADSVLEDAARLDFIERHPEMSLRHRKGRWAFLGFTNYEYDLHQSLREAIDTARKQGGA